MSMRSKYPSNNESGFVTVLMVLLVGMAIAASAVGTAYYVNSAQKGLVSGHALTNAKSGAWTGVETFRQYLESLNAAQINALNGKTGITLTAGSRTLKVKSLSVAPVASVGTTNSTYRITAEIQNSSVASKSSATVQVVYDVTLAASPSVGGGPTTVTVGGAMNFYGDLNASGNINFSNGTKTTVGNVKGNFTSGSGASGFESFNVGGIADVNATHMGNVAFYANLGVVSRGNTVIISQGSATFEEKPIVNALDFEANANYVFYVDASGNIKVDVKHVEGRTNRTYSLTELESNLKGMISYSNGEWTLNAENDRSDPSIAPGVLLFKGTLSIGNKGTFVNTIMATGNIEYGNKNVSLTAPNRKDANTVCNSAFQMPTNLCNLDKTLKNETIGDIALLAGSCTDTTSVPNCSDTYTGGNISFVSQSTVTGSIVAGNSIDAQGGTTISGPVLAAALSKIEGNRGSKFGGSFTIDFGGISDTGKTITLPGGGGTGGSGTTTTQTSQIKWARYL